MTSLRYSRTGASLAFSTLLIGSALLIASLSPVFAAPAAGTAKARVAVAEAAKDGLDGPAATGSTKPAEGSGAGCLRSRKKLWVDGDGWIVRRVTVC